ncbi:hypothetical protein VTH06DRAFT_8654 [Thermothelomyces fergusii]
MATGTDETPEASQKSPWPWSGRKRRNSESSLSSLCEFVTRRRNSLSESGREPNVLRKRPPESPAATSRARKGKEDDEGRKLAGVGAAGARPAAGRKDSKSESRPPPAFFNRVKHRYTSSASAILRWYTINPDEDAVLTPSAAPSRNPCPAGPSPCFKTAAPPTLRPPPSRSDDPLAAYPVEKLDSSPGTQRAGATARQPTTSRPMSSSPGMEHAPLVHMPTARPDGPFPGPERSGGYNKPRRLSNSSASSSSSSSVVSGQDSFDGRPRTASVASSQTSFDSYKPGVSPRSGAGPAGWAEGGAGQQYPWQRPAPLKQRRRAQPGELFAALPGEVLELILGELRKLHLRPGSSSCATCWMRDCCSVAVAARKFLRHAREALYQHIQLVGHEGPAMKKRTKTTYGSRLVLLRRTLRANPQIAAMVRTLKPPARPLSVGAVAYNDLIASVVMACPNLERLVGYYPTYDHSFQRLFHALSTRRNLKGMDWILEPSAQQRQQRTRSPARSDRWTPEDLSPQEAQLFLAYHANWRQLTTLVVHCQPGAALGPASILDSTIRALPSLENLFLSHLPRTTFDDTSLLSLPPLKKLSLNYCAGVTTAGLSALATRRNSVSIQTLTLLHMNVESLPAVARIFSYLTNLEAFTIVQTCAPEMPPDEFIMLFPYLASQSLRKLHWDIPYLPNTVTPADTILARSIDAGGFPSLRVLCTPNDPEGIFQALCAPRERIDLPTDRYRAPFPGAAGLGSGAPWGHTRNNSSFSNLLQARLAAQARLEAAQRNPRYLVTVVDERGALVERFGVGAFLGRVESRIRYVLAPDGATGATDESGGVVAVEDLVTEDGGETVGPLGGGGSGSGGSGDKKNSWRKGAGGGGGGGGDGFDSDAEGARGRKKEGCTGRWNSYNGVVVDKKDKERWWHQERGRWRELGALTTATPAVRWRRDLSTTAIPADRRTWARRRPAASQVRSAATGASPGATGSPSSAAPSQPPSVPTYYALFPETLPDGPPPKGKFAIDLRALRNEFLRLQAASHPDFHHHAASPGTAGEDSGSNGKGGHGHKSAARLRAEATSALINAAYRTLSSPLLRAQYLLREQHGLLAAVLEAREAIEAAETEEDLGAVAAANEARIGECERRVGDALERADVAAAVAEAVRLRYWVNIRECVRDWERGKPVVLQH